ncbi:MAG: AI-2E family transporter, partial [Lachnospiraceae bacterium]|nr:AI-2E family transporter [Lachnospiraceae bacterium]
MKLKINSKYFKWGITAFSVIAGGICFYYLIFHISEFTQNVKSLFSVVMPVVFGLIIAYLLTPILNFIEQKILNPLFDRLKIKETARRKKVIRGIAVILTSLLMIFAIYALIAMLISQIVPSIQTIISNFDDYVGELSTWLNNLMEDNQELKNYVMPQVTKLFSSLEDWLDDTANLLEKSGEVLKTVSLSILSFLKVAWNFIIGFIISIYVLASKETFSAQGKKMIYAIFETDSANAVLSSLRFVHKTFIGFISGKVLDSVIIGLLCFIGTTLLGTPYAALVSVIVGVTNVIPFFGPYLGAIPCAFLILIVDLSHPMNCVTFVIFILILQQVDGNLIGPRILGDSTGLSGFWVIFSITLFGGLFGILGMIVGVPIF